MRKINAILISAALVLGATASMDAFAGGGHRGGHHHHSSVGVYFGAPIGFGWGYGYAPWYSYPAPYYYPYYYPAPVAYSPAPATYVEQGQEAAPAPQSNAPRADAYWYYCPDSKTYYPYVNQCAGGWQKVSPKPSS